MQKCLMVLHIGVHNLLATKGVYMILLIALSIFIFLMIVNKFKKPKICYGDNIGKNGSSREGTSEFPNFYNKS